MKNNKKPRRRWWEFNERAAAYMRKNATKARWIHEKHPDLFYEIVFVLPHGFTCFDYRKDLQTYERVHWTMVEAMHRHLAFEYDMLEIDRLILRRIHAR